MRNFFQRLRARHYSWATVLAIVGIWWPTYIIFTPPEFIREGPVDFNFLTIAMLVGVLGSGTKISGYLASQQTGKLGVLGVSVELVGLVLAAVAPFAYLAVTGAVAISEGRDFLNSASILAIAIMAMYAHRAVIIVPRFLREAHDESKE